MRFILMSLLFSLSSCWMLRAYKVRKLELTDHRKLPSVTIAKSDNPFEFLEVPDKNKYKKVEIIVDSLITNTETAAFLVIRNDSLIYEKYFMGFNKNSL